jgi:hypothetical protein
VDHENVRGEIPAYIAGRLEGADLRRLEAHLGECSDCADLVEDGREIAAAVRRGASEGQAWHPDEIELKDYALRGKARPEIGVHLQSCDACQIVAAAWRAWSTGPLRIAPPAPMHRRLAAAVATLAAGLAIGLWYGHRPAQPLGPAQGPAPPMREQPAPPLAQGGAVDLLPLVNPMRSRTTPLSIEIDRTQPFILIGAPVDLPLGATPADRFTFEIRDAGGKPLWSTDLTADRIRRSQRTADVVILAIPDETLPPGRYQLRVSRTGHAGVAPLTQVDFELRTRD